MSERDNTIKYIAQHDIRVAEAIADYPYLIRIPEIREKGIEEATDAYTDLISNLGLPQEEVERTVAKQVDGPTQRERKLHFVKVVRDISKGK
mgnify:CR=1 FL=1